MTKAHYVCQNKNVFSFESLKEIIRFKYLLQTFVKRDLKIRYRYTVLGGLWNIIQPLSMMAIFSLVFSRIFHVETGGVPYPLFSYSVLILWQSVARMVTQGGSSLSGYIGMLTKVYFPRILIPISIIIGACIDFLIACILLIGMICIYDVSLTSSAFFALPILVLITILGSGVTFWVSALDAQFRDVRAALPFLMQIWMFATPLMYPSSLVPERWMWLYNFNPLVAQVELFRWSLLDTPLPKASYIITSVIISILLFCTGLFYFQKVEGTLVDKV
ncbi:MAG: ABC transporter permease [Alphaproteobacteria bacterium]|nr:ABC transporter permease [Alphaproteobacteria bacterium]